MKRIFTFLFALFAVLGTWAAAQLPEFATEQAGKWYYVQFSRGGAFLTDEGLGASLKTRPATGQPGQKWKLVGSEKGFLLKNQLGRYVNINGKFNAQNTGATFHLVQSTHKDYPNSWELQRDGQSKCMNQDGGYGYDKPLAEYGAADPNNALVFVPVKKVDALLPTYSDANNATWYKLKFNAGGNYLEDKGENVRMTTNTEVKCKEQKWQFVGNANDYQLRSRTGRYLAFKEVTWGEKDKGNRYTTVATAQEGAHFCYTLSANADGFEIQRHGTVQCLNQNGGTNTGRDLAEWNYNDDNNKLTWIADPFVGLPEFSVEAQPVWYKVGFTKGGAFLEDKGAAANVMTANNVLSDGQKWMFEGDEYHFVMRSANGNYLTHDGSKDRFKTTAIKSEAADLHFVQHTDGFSLELQVEGQSACMNQNGGQGANYDLTTWTAGDGGNAFSLVLDESPSFGKGVYYFIQFGNNHHVLKDCGEANVQLADLNENDEKLFWTFEGNGDKFQIKSKSGLYAYIDGTGNAARLKLRKTASEKGFKLILSENGKYLKSYEIQANGVEGNNILNQWGGTDVGNAIGLWSHKDDNNALYFPNAVNYKDIIPTPPTPPTPGPADFAVAGKSAYTPESTLTLWYDRPATVTGVDNKWMEYSLPIGNGELGACLFGGIATDEIQFNEKTLWEGGPTIGNHGGYKNFGSVFVKNLGLDIQYDEAKGAQNYVRFLDLEKAVAGVDFENKAANKTSYSRRYLSSEPDGVIAAHYVATGSEKLHLQFTVVPGEGINASEVVYKDGCAEFHGKMTTVSYSGQFKVVPTGSNVLFYSDEDGVTVSNADEVLLILCGGTDFDLNQPNFIFGTDQLQGKIKTKIDNAAQKGWQAIYDAHVPSFQKWMGRVSLNIGGAKSTVNTEQLIKNYNTRDHTSTEAENLFLEQLYFAYGRYLLIGSSRGMNVPNNLQGIWNNKEFAPWNSDIHANINIQMNYWPAEPTNLSDLHLPFLEHMIKMADGEAWKKAAQMSGEAKGSDGKAYVNGAVKGWTLFTENNIFGGMSTWGSNYCVANAWYCSHLWQHYRYTLDYDFLKRAFPAMWSAAEYWMQRMIQDRGHKNGYQPDGTYVCPDEFSAEQHDNGKEDATAHAQQLVYGLLKSVKESADILGTDAHLTTEQLAQLDKYLAKTDRGLHKEEFKAEAGWDSWGAKFGVKKGDVLLKEWKYTSYAISKDKGHRHMSHLMALYPLDQIAPNSEYFTPAVNALKLRGDDATGWSMGWKVNLWARALDGNHAHKILHNALRHSTAYGTDQSRGGIYYNLFDSHAPFQIDGNFGVCAGVAEMLLQSHTGTIQLLPALPDAWKSGSIKGLKAVGNFEVNIDWAAGKATKAVITSNKGQYLKLNAKDIANVQVLVNKQEVAPKVVNNDNIELSTKVNDVIEINFGTPAVGSTFAIKTTEGFGTVYSEKAFTMPANVNGSTVKDVVVGQDGIGTLVTEWEYPANSVVPAKTALLVKGTVGEHPYKFATSSETAVETNLLKGSAVAGMTENVENTYYYKLTYSMEGTPAVKTLGFFWGAEDGGAFMNGAGKAYLAVPQTVAAQVRGFRLTDEVTGIEDTVVAEEGETAIYNLAGVRMNAELNQLPKGVYIVNGKKVIIK